MIGDHLAGLQFPMVMPKGAGLTSGDTRDADALDWQARAVQNGSSVSAYTLRQVSDFCKACKRLALWDSLLRVNLFAGDTLNACLVPLKVGTGNNTETNSGSFAEVDYVEFGSIAGLKGDGSGKYLNTGWNPSENVSVSNAHLALYWSGVEANGTTRIVGGTIAGSDSFVMGWVSSGTKDAASLGGNAQYSPNPGTTKQQGSVIASLYGDRVLRYYVDGVEQATAVTQSATIPSNNLFVGASNNNGSAGNYTLRYLRAYHFGFGFSGPETYNLAQIMIDFQASLSRKV